MTAILEQPTPVDHIDHDLDDAGVPVATTSENTADTSVDQPRPPNHGDPAGEYLWLDPKKLIRAPNRDPKPVDTKFDATIAEYGNFAPLITRRIGPDEYEVHDGWNRVISLCKTDWLARAVVLPEDASQAQIDREIERIALQFVTGGMRFEQTGQDRYNAAKQMLDLGLPVRKAAKALIGMPVKEVSAVKAVLKAPNVERVHHDGGLDIFQAQQVAAEFGDDQQIADDLAAAAAEHMFEHRFQELIRLRDARAAAEQAEAEANATRARVQAVYEQTVTDFIARGFIVLEEPEPEAGDPYPQLSDLVTAAGDPPTADSITSPQNFAVRLIREVRRIDDDELIDPDLIDELSVEYPEEPAAEGYYHINDVVVHESFVPIYYCLDPGAEGLVLADSEDTDALDLHEDPDAAQDDPDCAADRQEDLARQREEEQKRAQAAAERAAQNKRSNTLNNLVRDSTRLRREKVAKHLFGGAKTVPAGAWELIGKVAQHPELLDRYHAKVLAAELQNKVPNSPKNKGIEARDNHGALRTLLRVVAALEAHLQPTENSTGGADAWRRPSSFYGELIGFLRTAIKEYAPAPIERMLAGELTVEQVLAGTSLAPTQTDDVPGESASVDDTATSADTVLEQKQDSAEHDGAPGDGADSDSDHDN